MQFCSLNNAYLVTFLVRKPTAQSSFQVAQADGFRVECLPCAGVDLAHGPIGQKTVSNGHINKDLFMVFANSGAKGDPFFASRERQLLAAGLPTGSRSTPTPEHQCAVGANADRLLCW